LTIYAFLLFIIIVHCSNFPRHPSQPLFGEMAFPTTIKNIEVDGLSLFYRSASLPTNPTILLLHGFPSSSHQYRNLIPLLAANTTSLPPIPQASALLLCPLPEIIPISSRPSSLPLGSFSTHSQFRSSQSIYSILVPQPHYALLCNDPPPLRPSSPRMAMLTTKA
jgi:hypothetical protein